MGKVVRIALMVVGLAAMAVLSLFAAMMGMIALFIVPGVIKNDSTRTIEVRRGTCGENPDSARRFADQTRFG